jgi:signal peptidase I
MSSKKASLSKSLGLLFLAVGLILAFRWILFEPFVIPSGSMIPTLLINDHIVVTKYSFGVRLPFSSHWLVPPELPRRGDVVVFRSIEKDDYYMIKRVVGLPGDRVAFTEEGDLVINGEKIPSQISQNPPLFNEVDLGDDPHNFTLFEEKLGHHTHYGLLEKNAFRYSQRELVVPPNRLFLMGDNRDHSRDSRFWGELPIENLLGRATYVWLSCEKTLSQVNIVCDPRFIRWHRFFHRIE